MQLYFDESGNTGLDLLNCEQRVAALASTSLTADQALELLAPLLRPGQREAKYSRLKGTVRGREALLTLFSSDLISYDNSRIVVADKRYYVITHLVDKLIEPTLYERGIDLYAGDAHVNMVRMFYYAGPYIFPDGRWNRLLKAFVATLRNPSVDALRHYDAVLDEAAHSAVGGEYGPEAAGIWATRGRAAEFLRGFTDIAVFDPMPDLFIMLVNFWMADTDGMFEVIHDVSKPLRRNEAFLRLMMTPLASRRIGYGQRTTELPLRVSDLRFADSEQHPQIQLADLMAGAAVDLLNSIAGYCVATPYHAALRDGRMNDLIAGAMVPFKAIERANDPLEGQTSLVDGAADFFHEASTRRP